MKTLPPVHWLHFPPVGYSSLVANAFEMRDKLVGLPCLSLRFMGSFTEGLELQWHKVREVEKEAFMSIFTSTLLAAVSNLHFKECKYDLQPIQYS